MKTTQSNSPDYTVYPGEYVPLFFEDEQMEEGEDNPALPLVNITELPDSYKVEVMIAGAKKEELLVNADQNVLSVSLQHHIDKPNAPHNYHVHEFECKSFNRNIILPENADLSFVSAEYFAGILNIHIPKTNHQSGDIHATIVVY